MHQLLGFVPSTVVSLGVVVKPGPVERVPLSNPVTHQDLVGPGVVLLPWRHLHFSHWGRGHEVINFGRARAEYFGEKKLISRERRGGGEFYKEGSLEKIRDLLFFSSFTIGLRGLGWEWRTNLGTRNQIQFLIYFLKLLYKMIRQECSWYLWTVPSSGGSQQTTDKCRSKQNRWRILRDLEFIIVVATCSVQR